MCPHMTWMKTVLNDPESHNLTLKQSIWLRIVCFGGCWLQVVLHTLSGAGDDDNNTQQSDNLSDSLTKSELQFTYYNTIYINIQMDNGIMYTAPNVIRSGVKVSSYLTKILHSNSQKMQKTYKCTVNDHFLKQLSDLIRTCLCML